MATERGGPDPAAEHGEPGAVLDGGEADGGGDTMHQVVGYWALGVP